MLIALQSVLLLLIGTSIAFYIWCILSTSRFFTKSTQLPEVASGRTLIATRQEVGAGKEPVSVLIPVCGVDEDAIENWESFCQQDYEHYEVLFGVMNPKDPAVPIVEELVARFPERARLVFCLEVRGLNYKFSNLMHLLEAAQHEVVILTDSDIWVKPEYLRTVTSPLLDPKVGIVTCGYLGHEPKSLPAALASLGRCIDFIPSVLVARSWEDGLRFALGATIATRKSVLEQVGGLQTVVNRVGCDYYIGNMVAAAGYRVEISQYILETNNGQESWRHLLQRELRWTRMSRWNRGALYYSIACTYGSVYCIPLLMLSGGDRSLVIVGFATLALRAVQAVVCIYTMECPKLFWWLWTLPIRDLMSFIIWVAGIRGQTIHWRGRRLLIGRDGVLTE